ncbi:hypothetical protein HY632_01650 [Candidatus Uhrbacteria bacterium]|nr:hypothetical protein [Candidatus Uhrbacteria bacterium]
MRALSRKYDDVGGEAERVTGWLASERRRRIEDAVQRVRAPGAWFNATCWWCFVATALLALIGMVAGTPNHPGDSFVWYPFTELMLMLCGMSFVVAGAMTVLRAEPTETLRIGARQRLTQECDADPLVRRAQLIVDAAKEYRRHVAQYRAWRVAVDDEVAAVNPASEDAYHAFIDQARAVLQRTMENFWNVQERLRRAEEIRRTHPAVGDGTTGLAALLAELKIDLEPPKLPGAIVDPAAALEDERALAKVAEELRMMEGGQPSMPEKTHAPRELAASATVSIANR